MVLFAAYCSFCNRQEHQEFGNPIVEDSPPNFTNPDYAFQNPEPAHASQIPADYENAEFPSVKMMEPSTDSSQNFEKLQTSVLVYPPTK
ncbi:hypothetical protein TRFO_02093 [Tritrichomonas foetus]|uniref:Uncharacterized protein n=1 Tax=Tritrichomonas foetus TaxID=1144522 RepID=A0A1J4JIC3_9EUKA|nr:hypothetical protein TRFO_02093 [Tritrichomonas foetus]|eukprot:OHS96948.1 hypothetical protein TRFO_02093 [Tritrichomonas foetus]